MHLRLITFMLCLLLAISAMPASAADQPLPPSIWYAVVWNSDSDTLHWINAGGEQASIPRPKLPGESVDSAPALQFSRDGRYLLITASLQSQVRGLGIYNLQAGHFVATHQSQPGESIHLGRTHTSNLNSQRMAVGLANTDPATPAWRVLVFDVTTGTSVAQITSSELNIFGAAAYRMPLVVYYDLDEGLAQEVVHFQLLPINAGGSPTYEAYAWNLNTGTVTASPYTGSDVAIQYLSGEMALPLYDPNYSALEAPPMLGISYNAIGRGFDPANLSTVWVDSTRYNYSPRWAVGGQWLLYRAQGEPFADNWNVILANGTPADNQQMPLGPNVQGVWGTPDGYLALTDTGSLLFMNQFEVEAFAANFGSLVFQVPADQSASVVYASDTGAFALSSIGDGGGVVVAGPADIVAPAVESCPGAPPLRLQVGSSARVSFTNGIPLRVRATPGGQIITQIAEGTAFTVIGGPQCQGNYAWWQIRTSGGTEGWSAEGDVNSYFIEPVQPRSQADVIVSLPTATPTPQLMIAVLPTATPGLVIAAPEDICNLAPTTRLQPQMQARTNTPGGTLAMRFSPTDEFPSNQIPHNSVVSVQGQSRCREGYRIWPVAVTLDGQIVTGWVSEGTQQQYFLDPLP